MIQFKENARTEGRTEGRTGQILFYRILPATAGGPKNDLIRKLRLILNFMTSQPGYQAITIHMLPNISQRRNEIRPVNGI